MSSDCPLDIAQTVLPYLGMISSTSWLSRASLSLFYSSFSRAKYVGQQLRMYFSLNSAGWFAWLKLADELTQAKDGLRVSGPCQGPHQDQEGSS